MSFQIHLDYTPRSPQEGTPFTESSFVRKGAPFTFDIGDIGVALVDLWNVGWGEEPIDETRSEEMSFERGRSHAERKKRVTIEKIAPTVNELRSLGVQIFHCNHPQFLHGYP